VWREGQTQVCQADYQRPRPPPPRSRSRPPPPPPVRSGFGRASFTFSVRPPS